MRLSNINIKSISSLCYLRNAFWVLLFVFVGNISTAQSYRSHIKSMFDKTSDGLWISEYKGVFDHTFPVTLTLGKSEIEYRGILSYKNSSKTKNVVMTVEGYIRDGILHLSEYDIDGQHTGYLTLQKNGTSFIGKWVGIKGVKEYDISFSKTTNLATEIDTCLSPYISKYYHDASNDIELQYYRNSNNTSISIVTKDTAITWLEDKNIDFNQELSHRIKDRNYKIIPLENGVKLLRIEAISKRENFHLLPTKELSYGCQMFIDYNTKAEVHYPLIGEEKFDSWIKDQIDKIWNTILVRIQEDNSNSDSPYERNNNEIYIHSQVMNYSDKWLSGLIYIQNTGLEKIQTVPFTYDMKKKKAVKMKKIFKSNQGELIFQKYVDNARHKANFLPLGIERDWLKSVNYDNRIIVDNAIVLYTEFNTIFGDRSIRIPIKSVKDKLKKIK